jgi:hypothetical protein
MNAIFPADSASLREATADKQDGGHGHPRQKEFIGILFAIQLHEFKAEFVPPLF